MARTRSKRLVVGAAVGVFLAMLGSGRYLVLARIVAFGQSMRPHESSGRPADESENARNECRVFASCDAKRALAYCHISRERQSVDTSPRTS